VQTETVTCGGCGAPLSIPDNVEYVACRFCQAQLHVQRNHSVVFTEVLQSLHDQTTRLADNTEMIRLRQDLDFLDKEWKEESAEFVVRESNGNAVLPTREQTVLEGQIIVACTVIGTVAMLFFHPLLFLIGLVCILAAVGHAKLRQEKVARFEGLRAVHQQKRQALLDRLQKLDSAAESASNTF
jgi:LSD1 subclass zinc finger protein